MLRAVNKTDHMCQDIKEDTVGDTQRDPDASAKDHALSTDVNEP